MFEDYDISVQNPLLSLNEIEPSLHIKILFEYYSNLLSYTSWILKKKLFASALCAGGGMSQIAALLSLPY